MYIRFYKLLSVVFFLIGAPLVVLFCLLSGKHRDSLRERFGYLPHDEFSQLGPTRLWFHAASVGEVQVAKVLIRETARLIPNASFVLTSVTQQGKKVACKQLHNESISLYAPLDFHWVAKRFLQAIQPTLYICLETELWPNMIHAVANSKTNLLLLNGRMSENSFKNYKWVAPLVGETLRKFSFISCITEKDRQRFATFCGNSVPIEVNGNAKYASTMTTNIPSKDHDFISSEPPPRNLHVTQNIYAKKLDIYSKNTVFIAGSTHEKEEALLLEVFLTLQDQIPNLLFILAPRHITRTESIEVLLQAKRCQYDLFSSLETNSRRSNIVLLDSMGELADLYSVAQYIFCGGSLVNRGGHNIIEPARWGKPVFYGPHMNDFKDAQYLLESEGVGFSVNNNQELVHQIMEFHHDQTKYQICCQKALKLTSAQQGAALRQAQIIAQFVEQTNA